MPKLKTKSGVKKRFTLTATGKLKLMDVAELSPPLDRDNVTARVAARLIHRVTHAAMKAARPA